MDGLFASHGPRRVLHRAQPHALGPLRRRLVLRAAWRGERARRPTTWAWTPPGRSSTWDPSASPGSGTRASYVLFDGSAVTFVRLEYDHQAAAAAIRQVSDLPDFLADRARGGPLNTIPTESMGPEKRLPFALFTCFVVIVGLQLFNAPAQVSDEDRAALEQRARR